MADYRQSTVSGHAWTRAYSVTLLNPINEASTAIFSEEDVVALGDGKHIKQPAGACSDEFTAANAGESFDLVHPVTGQVVGTATYQDVYVLMASLYMHVALKRDAAEVARQEQEAARQALLNAAPPPADVIVPPPAPAPAPVDPAPAPAPATEV